MRIRAEDITKKYGQQVVLDHFTADFCTESAPGRGRVEAGTGQAESGSGTPMSGCYLITAPSGAGKTTLIRILLGLERPDAGKVLTDGEVSNWPAGRTLLPLFAGVVFQEDRLCENFPSVENVTAFNRHLSRREAQTGLLSLLPKEALSRKVSELSGGMRRRVAVVRACLSEAEVMVLDEPFAGLDQESREKTLDYILEKRRGRLLIIASHEREGMEEFTEVRL